MTRGYRHRRAFCLVLASAMTIALTAASCSNSNDASDPFAGPASSIASADPDAGQSPLAGMRGTTPGVNITPEFRDAVLAEDASLSTLSGAAEGYDAMTIIAAAAEAARSDAPGRIANEIIGVTARGNTCVSYMDCREFIEKLRAIDYEGASGGIQMLPNGDPGEGGFGVTEFDGAGELVSVDSTTALADPLGTDPPTADLLFGPRPDGVVRVGTLLPPDGPDGANAAAAHAGARAALREINSIGGPLGDPLELIEDAGGDGSPEATLTAVGELIDAEVDAVIGGTNAEITAAAIGPLTDAGIILISPTDSSREFAVASDRGLFFRLAPPADLEGKALGRLVANDGHVEVGLISGPRPTDLDFANDLEASLETNESGVSAVLTAEATGTLDAAIEEFVAQPMSAVVVSGDVEYAARVIEALVKAGKGPRDFSVYGTSEVMVPRLNELVESA